jgi:hypothetical protein
VLSIEEAGIHKNMVFQSLQEYLPYCLRKKDQKRFFVSIRGDYKLNENVINRVCRQYKISLIYSISIISNTAFFCSIFYAGISFHRTNFKTHTGSMKYISNNLIKFKEVPG